MKKAEIITAINAGAVLRVYGLCAVHSAFASLRLPRPPVAPGKWAPIKNVSVRIDTARKIRDAARDGKLGAITASWDKNRLLSPVWTVSLESAEGGAE
jgi:hypothetical protein